MSEKKITQEQIVEIVKSISQPVFNYAIKRFVKQINMQEKMDINDIITIFLGSMATCDANLLRWIKAFGMSETKKNVNITTLKEFFMKEVNVQLEQKLH